MWRLLTCLTLSILGCGVAAGAGGQPLVLRVTAKHQEVGAWDVADASYAAAIEGLGTPDSCILGYRKGLPPARNFARIAWRSLGVRAVLATYGGFPNGGDACSEPRAVYADTVWITGKRWRTLLGLRVGDSATKLRRLYPKALPHGGSFWIVIRKSHFGDAHLEPLFRAEVRAGRVTAFVLWIQGAGD